MTANVIGSLSQKNWVKLQLEPVEVCLDFDENLLFSTVQSVVPGAHGLYYRENGQRRALDFDTNTGKVFAPSAGWNSQNIYIHLAHGSRHGTHFADYSAANQQFEKNVSAVQKLIAAAGLTASLRPPRKDKTTRTNSRTRGVKSGFEAQPENAPISDESDNNTNSIERKTIEINKLLDENEALKIQLKEAKDPKAEKKNTVVSPGQTVVSTTGEADAKDEKLIETEKILNEYRNIVEDSKLKIFEKDEEVRRKSDDIGKLHWELSEAKQLAVQEKQRADDLERELNNLRQQTAGVSGEGETIEVPMDRLPDVSAQLASVREGQGTITEHINQLNASLSQTTQELRNAETRISELTEKEEEIANLHSVIEDLRTHLATSQKDAANKEIYIAEQREWLKNQKEKIINLEAQLELNNLDSASSTVVSMTGSSRTPRSRTTSESMDDATKAQVRSLETKLQLANSALRTAEADKQKLQEANWYANERIANLEKDNGYLKGSGEALREKLQNCSNEGIIAEKDARIYELVEQRSKLEWRIGELNQWWSDAKWKVGELEAGVANQRNLIDTAHVKIQSLNEQAPLMPSTSTISSSFSVRQSFPGQWQLVNGSTPQPQMIQPMVYPQFGPIPMQNYQMKVPQIETKRVFLELDGDYDDVFLVGSFLNWQCALRCDPLPNGRKGIAVDIPKGRHEFRFLAGGQWLTSTVYPSLPNGFGGENNILIIE